LRPFLVGIAGPSCSGKTEIARLVAATLQSPVLSLDSYYVDLSHLTWEERERVNFDAPESLREDLVAAHVEALSRGVAIEKPVYDFARHCPNDEVELIHPASFVLIEGLFTLHWESVRKNLALRVFVAASHHVCLDRRLKRDVEERGRTPKCVLAQYEATVRPMCDRYVNSSLPAATLVLDGEQPIVDSASQLLDAIRASG
jgi:uridine kinase